MKSKRFGRRINVLLSRKILFPFTRAQKMQGAPPAFIWESEAIHKHLYQMCVRLDVLTDEIKQNLEQEK